MRGRSDDAAEGAAGRLGGFLRFSDLRKSENPGKGGGAGLTVTQVTLIFFLVGNFFWV